MHNFTIDNGCKPTIYQNEMRDTYLDFSFQTVEPNKLPNKFTYSEEGLNYFILKKCAFSLSLPLSLVFSKSYDTSEIPRQWRTGYIVPIFKKKGNRNNPNNYRSVTITSPVVRILEVILTRQIKNVFGDRIYRNQFFFCI